MYLRCLQSKTIILILYVTFTWRTQQVQKFPHLIPMDGQCIVVLIIFLQPAPDYIHKNQSSSLTLFACKLACRIIKKKRSASINK